MVSCFDGRYRILCIWCGFYTQMLLQIHWQFINVPFVWSLMLACAISKLYLIHLKGKNVHLPHFWIKLIQICQFITPYASIFCKNVNTSLCLTLTKDQLGMALAYTALATSGFSRKKFTFQRLKYTIDWYLEERSLQ